MNRTETNSLQKNTVNFVAAWRRREELNFSFRLPNKKYALQAAVLFALVFFVLGILFVEFDFGILLLPFLIISVVFLLLKLMNRHAIEETVVIKDHCLESSVYGRVHFNEMCKLNMDKAGIYNNRKNGKWKNTKVGEYLQLFKRVCQRVFWILPFVS